MKGEINYKVIASAQLLFGCFSIKIQITARKYSSLGYAVDCPVDDIKIPF